MSPRLLRSSESSKELGDLSFVLLVVSEHFQLLEVIVVVVVDVVGIQALGFDPVTSSVVAHLRLLQNVHAALGFQLI